MTSIQLETYVKEQFNMGLYEFVKQKVEKEKLYDYELADILKVNGSFIGKLRNSFGVKRSAKFSRRFEQIYGAGAVERFKKIIENPNNTLVDVAGNFEFSREYARQAYEKIYGYPYTEAFRNKLQMRKRKMLASRKKSKHLNLLIKLKEKMESLGLNLHLKIQKHSYAILTNGYKLLVRHALTTVTIGKKQYFHITTGAGPADTDFIICLCRNNGESIYYVIPRHVMPKCGVYLLPEAGPGESKYVRFKEAWHLLNHKKLDKGGIMRAKDTKPTSKKHIFSDKFFGQGQGVQPGHINFGSRLDHENSLKARLRTEIDLAIKGNHA